MILNWQLINAPENELGFEILVKKGDSYLDSDLTGTWIGKSLGTQYDSQPDNYGYDNGVLTIQDNGAFLIVETGTTSEESGGELSWSTGTASVDANGVVSLSFDGESLVLDPVLCASKDVMINNYKDPGDELGLEIFIKKELLPGDLNHDGIVNLLDFAIFVDHWLEGIE